jgi:hypothetical protein
VSAATATATRPRVQHFQPPGQSRTRLANPTRLLLFGGILLIVLIVAITSAVVLKRGTPAAPCQPERPCAAPPIGPRALVATVWTSRDLGFEFQYDADVFQVASQDGRAARLTPKNTNLGVEMVVSGVPAAEANPQKALRDRLSSLSNQIVGLTPDKDPATIIVTPTVGYTRGVGGSYRGTVNAPQGPSTPVVIAAMAAGDARTTAVVSVAVPLPVSGSKDRLALLLDFARREGDLALKTFRWTTGP